MMQYVLLLISLSAAIIGILGPSHRERAHSIWRRITPLGWASACVALLGFCFSAWLVYQQDRSTDRVRTTAVNEVETAVNELINTLYLATFVAFDESYDQMPFHNRPSLTQLKSEELVAHIAKTSL